MRFFWAILVIYLASPQFGEKISNKICELLSERKCEQFHDPFGVVFSDFFMSLLVNFWQKKVSETLVAIFDCQCCR